MFYRPPQALCLQHDKRLAWRNLLCSYARTWCRSVSLMSRASESFVKNWNRGTVIRNIPIQVVMSRCISLSFCFWQCIDIRTSFWSHFDSPSDCVWTPNINVSPPTSDSSCCSSVLCQIWPSRSTAWLEILCWRHVVSDFKLICQPESFFVYFLVLQPGASETHAGLAGLLFQHVRLDDRETLWSTTVSESAAFRLKHPPSPPITMTVFLPWALLFSATKPQKNDCQ